MGNCIVTDVKIVPSRGMHTGLKSPIETFEFYVGKAQWYSNQMHGAFFFTYYKDFRDTDNFLQLLLPHNPFND